MGDGYSNFIFDGEWISRKGTHYSAYFADGKLDIGDLNVGAGEFVPNDKYLKYGWWDFTEMYYADDTALVNEMKKLKAQNKP